MFGHLLEPVLIELSTTPLKFPPSDQDKEGLSLRLSLRLSSDHSTERRGKNLRDIKFWGFIFGVFPPHTKPAYIATTQQSLQNLPPDDIFMGLLWQGWHFLANFFALASVLKNFTASFSLVNKGIFV
jgi:hypothetical protein